MAWKRVGLLLVLALGGCKTESVPPVQRQRAKPPSKRPWTPATAMVATAPVWLRDRGKTKPLLRAIERSLEYLQRVPASRSFVFGPHKASRAQMLATLRDLKARVSQWGLGQRLSRYLAKEYRFFQSASGADVLFTGYYEASLRGSRRPTKKYRYPLYRRPPDLVQVDLRKYAWFRRHPRLPKVIRGRLLPGLRKRLVPYYSRSQIDDQGKLKRKGLELVWIDDPIDVFFLQIQGSGIVTFSDGATIRVNYADKNGHPYRPIGRLLLQEGALTRETMSMQSIRAYLEKHPKQQQRIFNYNPSYVFFRQVKRGPLGSLGVPVTAYRSVATDRFLFPKAALCAIQVKIPTFDVKGRQKGWRSLYRLVLNQDTGGAIRSPRRVDLFTGYGPQSELVAGHLKSKGRLFFLLKK